MVTTPRRCRPYRAAQSRLPASLTVVLSEVLLDRRIVFAFFAVTLSSLVACSRKPAEYMLGAASPQTAAYGIQNQHGIDLAVDEIGPQEWHFDVIAEREIMLATGATELISLEQFSKDLREELS